MNTKTTKPPTTPTPQSSSLPEWRPMDEQQEFEEDNADKMAEMLAASKLLEQAAAESSAAHDDSTKQLEKDLGRPLTPADKGLLDLTGF